MNILMRGYRNPRENIDPYVAVNADPIGNNSGNLIFSQSAIKTLSAPGIQIDLRSNPRDFEKPEEVNEKYDAVVLPFANAFRASFTDQLEFFADYFRKLTIPVTILGIGAQSTLDYGTEELDSISEIIKKFVGAALDRGPTLGVRGDFTRDYLKSLGFSEVETIGCPSMYMNGDHMSITPKVDRLSEDSKIALNATRDVNHGHEFIVRMAKKYHNMIYFPQTLSDLELMLWGTLDQGRPNTDYPNTVKHPLYAENRARFFLDAGSWIQFISEYDFSIGSRIHGNVAALLASVPAHVLVHDSRTRELAEYFEIPHTRVDDISAEADLAEMYESSDFTNLQRNHGERFRRFIAYLEKHNLPHIYKNGQNSASLGVEPTPGAKPIEVVAVGPEAELISRLGMERRKSIRRDRVSRRLIHDLSSKVAYLERQVNELSARVEPVASAQAAKSRSNSLPRRVKNLMRRIIGK